MLPLERQQAILNHLIRHGAVSVNKLSAWLGVSEMTIRRDIKRLEQEGAAMRTHGGAVLAVDPEVREPRFEEKVHLSSNLKEIIAEYAVEHFVDDGATVFLEGGTTVTAMASYLAERRRNLTVLTNGLNTLTVLKTCLSHSTVLSCGGILREGSYTFVGPVSEQFFSQFNAQTVFLSASGCTIEQGFTDPNVLEGQVKRSMARVARRKVMLLDSTKFGTCSLLTTFPITDIDVLVTDSGAPKDMLLQFEALGVQVHTVTATHESHGGD